MANEPSLEACGRDLRMKLQRQTTRADREGLALIALGRCEMHYAPRQVEGIAVPMQHARSRSIQFGEGTGRSLRGERYRRPADLLALGARVDCRAEGGGHDLAAETDAEHRG